jgi:2-polyprenyl-6-methoxyphenol hydroxylase-like FAD-dependent oxidoreductase
MVDKTALIIGAGIAGPAVALFLKRAGFQVGVFEAHESMLDIGGALQIAPNGMSVLNELGLAETILRSGVESVEFCFENQFGKILGCIPNGPASRYGLPAVQIRRLLVHSALIGALAQEGIPVHYSKRVRQITSSHHQISAIFEDGGSASGDILIGADGIHSQTRRILFPKAPPPRYTGLITVGGFAQSESLIPKDPSRQARAHLVFGLNGFFGYGYFDPFDSSQVMWWSHLQREVEPSAEELGSVEDEKLQRTLLARHHDWAEPVQTILRHATRILWGPVHDLPDMPSWSYGHAVLIGDAAHAISPHAGLGASLALEDAISVARQLRSNAPETAFDRFRRERQRRVQRLVATARKRGEGKHSLPPNAAKFRDFMLTQFLRFRGRRLFDEAYRHSEAWN